MSILSFCKYLRIKFIIKHLTLGPTVLAAAAAVIHPYVLCLIISFHLNRLYSETCARLYPTNLPPEFINGTDQNMAAARSAIMLFFIDIKLDTQDHPKQAGVRK